MEGISYPEILVRHLLILFGHCRGWWPCHHSCKGEDAKGDEEPNHGVAEDLHAFTWRGQGSRAVGAEGDIICCHCRHVSQSSIKSLSIFLPITVRALLMSIEALMELEGHTSFLLLQCQLGPVRFHSIPQGHPELRLLLRWHSLPSLLHVRERRV
jgi:hypothetical protein